MKIDRIIFQHRRDFEAYFVCEGCGHIVRRMGYDDRNFHDNVIPGMKCPACEKSSLDLGVDVRPLMTLYPEGFQV
ncbi:MAG: hypothetical protein GXY11_06745 [Clostridiales bacterium]|nr:hypothetical protein [Clostridiales bacterium]